MSAFNDEVVGKVSAAPTAFEAVLALVDVFIRYSIIPPQTGLAMLAKLNETDVKDRLEPAFWENTPQANNSGNLTAAQRQNLAAHPQMTQAQWDALKSNKDLTQEQWNTLSKGPVLTEAERTAAGVGYPGYGQGQHNQPGTPGQHYPQGNQGQHNQPGVPAGQYPQGVPNPGVAPLGETQAARIERESKGQ